MTQTAEPRSHAGRIVLLLIVGPILALGYKTGSRIAAEREAEKVERELASERPDGRPDPRALAHVERGSGAFLDVLVRHAREGQFEYRAAIARALGFSRRLECLRELVLELRDGCVSPELVALPRPWPCPCYPPDELALETGEAGLGAMRELERDEDPFVRGFAHTFLAATGERSIDGELLRLMGDEGTLGARAVAIAAASVEKPRVALDGAGGLVAFVGPTPLGRVCAALLVRSGAHVPPAREGEVKALAAALTRADVTLERDRGAVARAARALAWGDASAAATLGELASVDSAARDALVAAVASSDSADVREAAKRALEKAH